MFKFKDLSIGSKLVLGFGVLLIFLVVVAIAGYFSARTLTAAANEVVDEARHADTVMEMALAATKMMESEMTFLLNPTRTEPLKDYEKYKQEVEKHEADWRKSIEEEEEEERVKRFDAAREALLASIEQGLKLAKEGKIEEARKWELEQSDPKLGELRELLVKEEEIASADAQKAIAGAAAAAAFVQTLILTLSILAIIIGSLLAILITRAISNPVKAVADYADNLAKTGDLSKEIQIPGVTLKEGQAVQSKDEVTLMAGAFSQLVKNLREMAKQAAIITQGDLTQVVTGKGDLPTAFNTMVKNLRELVIKVLQTAQHVSASSQQLSSSAQQINSTTQEVSSTVQQIAKGAESTAQRVEETSKVMEQMGSSVSQVATSSQQTAAAATQANSSAQSGGAAISETVKTMDKIFGATSASSVVVKKLGEKAEEIGKIVDVITDIADQTNLLALNAAIEAARAGEAGRGFAVVAEEVRKLAEGASKSSDEISSLIKGANKDIESAVKSMDDSNKEVIQGKEVVAKAETAFAEILKAAGNAATMVQQVSAATQQMAAGSKQVVKSIDEIASSAEEAASATEQASASTEEMTASMEEMAASAQELANMAIELRELVGKFKTGAEVEKETVVMKPRKISEMPKVVAAIEKKMTTSEKLKDVRERIHKGVTPVRRSLDEGGEKPKEAA